MSPHAEATDKMGMKSGRWLGFFPFEGMGRNAPLRRWEKFFYRVTAREKDRFERFFLLGRPGDYLRLERLQAVSACPDRTELCFPSCSEAFPAYMKRLDGIIASDREILRSARSLGIRHLALLPHGWAGLFPRFPSNLEMWWAFQKWVLAGA